MLAHRLQRWHNIKTSLDQRRMSPGLSQLPLVATLTTRPVLSHHRVTQAHALSQTSGEGRDSLVCCGEFVFRMVAS